MTKRTVILGLVLVLAAYAAADTWTVTLADGKSQDGTLVRIEPARYLLQTDEGILELTDDDLDPATFTIRPAADAAPQRPLVETHNYHEVHADGNVTTHWQMTLHNTHSRAITELRFGMAPWERRHADQRTYRDPFGNELTPEYDPPRDRWADHPDQRVQLDIPLPVPVAPGETMIINCSETTPYVQREEDVYRYRFNGDFAEDRLIWHKVRLPHGAEIEDITPTPTSRFDQDGYQYVMWRRYYVKGEVSPLQITYTLP